MLVGLLSGNLDWRFWPTTFSLLAVIVLAVGGWLWRLQESLYCKTIHEFPNKGDIRSHRAE